MPELRQTITVAIDGQELAGAHSLEWETKRKEITAAGALGVANHTGVIGVLLNGHAAVRLWLHEDESGYVVIDVVDGQNGAHLARMHAELGGLVPPRTGSKQRRERRFGDDWKGNQGGHG
jgi:hypothetical protein